MEVTPQILFIGILVVILLMMAMNFRQIDQDGYMAHYGVIFGCIALAVLITWVYGRTWRASEAFTASTVKMVDDPSKAHPYTTAPINGVDDYEYSMIAHNEGDRAMTKASRDAFTSAYPRDWSVQPPSSELFQQGLAEFKQKPKAEPFDNEVSPYANLDGTATPPDTQASEIKERETLQTYVPKSPQSLTTYDAADAKEIVDRVYGAKGLIAEVKQTQPNVFTIVGTRKINEKVVYEDEQAPASTQPVAASGEGVIQVPPAAATGGANLQDKFFNTDTPTRQGKWDYTSWTPGLERAFAPTEPQPNWF